MTNKTAGEHTQGEWIIDKLPASINGKYDNMGKLFIVVKSNDEVESGICQILSDASDNTIQFDDVNSKELANAKLIASAPKMLEALESLMDDVGRGYTVPLWKQQNALAAIKSAKGE